MEVGELAQLVVFSSQDLSLFNLLTALANFDLFDVRLTALVFVVSRLSAAEFGDVTFPENLLFGRIDWLVLVLLVGLLITELIEPTAFILV